MLHDTRMQGLRRRPRAAALPRTLRASAEAFLNGPRVWRGSCRPTSPESLKRRVATIDRSACPTTHCDSQWDQSLASACHSQPGSFGPVQRTSRPRGTSKSHERACRAVGCFWRRCPSGCMDTLKAVGSIRRRWHVRATAMRVPRVARRGGEALPRPGGLTLGTCERHGGLFAHARMAAAGHPLLPDAARYMYSRKHTGS
eukprot:361582-Chlamydomonas_euryale.AAC.4